MEVDHEILSGSTSIMVAGKEYAKCNMCNNKQRAKAYRLKVHYIKCCVVHQLPEAELIPDRPIVRKRKRSPSPTPAKGQAHSMPIVSAQQHMDTHIVKTSTNYKNKIDLEVAKLFYPCNILFNVAEHSQVMNMLPNGYQSPSCKQIARNLLDSIYDQLQSDMKKLIDGPSYMKIVQDHED